MDSMPMLHRREQQCRGLDESVFYSIGADASKQEGEDYFLIREDALHIRKHKHFAANPIGCLRVESRTKPISTLAYGQATLHKKIARLAHAIMLDSGDLNERHRNKVVSADADRRTERRLWHLANVFNHADFNRVCSDLEAGTLDFNDMSAFGGFAFPRLTDCLGLMHILCNALKKGLKAQEDWPALEKCFRSIARLMKTRGLRKRFLSICLRQAPHEVKMYFRHWSGGTFTWKWDKMEVLFLQLALRIRPLLHY